MTNITRIEEKSPNAGTPMQPVDNKVVMDNKLSIAELYKLCFNKILYKYTPMDQEYVLENLVRDDCSIVNRFIKEVAAEAENIFDKQ